VVANIKFTDFKSISNRGCTDNRDATLLILAQAQNQLSDKIVKLDRPSSLKWGTENVDYGSEFIDYVGQLWFTLGRSN
jgi:hypothetical protein